MADINVERKRPSLRPWLIGLVMLAVLIWAAAQVLGGNDQPEPAVEVQEVR
jgi:hypothetical protein